MMSITAYVVTIFFIAIVMHVLRKRNATDDPEYQKFVAYHEAAHAVIAMYHGFKCVGLLLNVTKRGAQVIRKDERYAHGIAFIDSRNFANELHVISNSTLINLNIDALPKDKETIEFAKKYLLVLYAGDLIVQEIFNVPNEYLGIMNEGFTQRGQDLHLIQNIHDYLEKTGSPVTPENAKRTVFEIYDSRKEIRAAIHFLADAMLKSPGEIISENQIIDNLRIVNFFSICSNKTLGQLMRR